MKALTDVEMDLCVRVPEDHVRMCLNDLALSFNQTEQTERRVLNQCTYEKVHQLQTFIATVTPAAIKHIMRFPLLPSRFIY